MTSDTTAGLKQQKGRKAGDKIRFAYEERREEGQAGQREPARREAARAEEQKRRKIRWRNWRRRCEEEGDDNNTENNLTRTGEREA